MSIDCAANMIANAKYLIALSGSGISKESNVPTFRGEDGLWNEYDVMELATPQAFANNPTLVWEWYSWRQGLIASCEPNPAHRTLAKWESNNLLKCLITQNVDGLHSRAGSNNILEVHGNLWKLKCSSCEHRDFLNSPAEVAPKCPMCESFLRPDVVWFGEQLNPCILSDVYTQLEKSEICIVIGTSALIQPAASFPLIVKQRGGTIIEVNIEPTPLTSYADIHLQGKAGEIMPTLNSLLLEF